MQVSPSLTNELPYTWEGLFLDPASALLATLGLHAKIAPGKPCQTESLVKQKALSNRNTLEPRRNGNSGRLLVAVGDAAIFGRHASRAATRNHKGHQWRRVGECASQAASRIMPLLRVHIQRACKACMGPQQISQPPLTRRTEDFVQNSISARKAVR